MDAAHEDGSFRWLLLATDQDAATTAAQVAVAVLSGEAPVFGLAGLVLLDDDEPRLPPVPVAADLPVLLGTSERDIDRFWTEYAGRGPQVPDDFARMLASDRVSARTRGILARRVLADDPAYAPRALDPRPARRPAAVAARVVPAGRRSGRAARPRRPRRRAARRRTRRRLAARRPAAPTPRPTAPPSTSSPTSADLGDTGRDGALGAVAAGRRTPTRGSLTAAQLQPVVRGRPRRPGPPVAGPPGDAWRGSASTAYANGGDGALPGLHHCCAPASARSWEPRDAGSRRRGRDPMRLDDDAHLRRRRGRRRRRDRHRRRRRAAAGRRSPRAGCGSSRSRPARTSSPATTRPTRPRPSTSTGCRSGSAAATPRPPSARTTPAAASAARRCTGARSRPRPDAARPAAAHRAPARAATGRSSTPSSTSYLERVEHVRRRLRARPTTRGTPTRRYPLRAGRPQRLVPT